jgi:hypothetical protein
MTAALPMSLARRPHAVLRPRDAADHYAHPAQEFARLAAAGVLHRLAYGYYARVPAEHLGVPGWRPDLHAAALGIAQADAGVDGAALVHVSAARLHGALPREIALAVVAVGKQRPDLSVLGGTVHFMTRRVADLDLQRTATELGPGWVSTREQTVLDLAAHRSLGGLAERTVADALAALTAGLDWALLAELGRRQRRATTVAALRRELGRTVASS